VAAAAIRAAALALCPLLRLLLQWRLWLGLLLLLLLLRLLLLSVPLRLP
jgi:hypothetical protein